MTVQCSCFSGKTLAYAIPLVEQLRSLEPRVTRSDGTFAIIVVPTREVSDNG